MGDANNIWQTQLATAATQTGQAALGQVMGMVFGKQQDKRQLKQQEKLQQLQIQGSKELTDYNYAKQLQMWKDTNYGAQVEQLEAAGLNPGLLYGMSGGGGTTTGSGGGAQTSGGQAQGASGEPLAMAQTMIGMGLQRAQMENIQADTKVKEASIPKIETETKSLAQGIENQKAIEALTKMQTEIATMTNKLQKATFEESINILDQEIEKNSQEINRMRRQNWLDGETARTKINQMKAELINTYATEQLIKSGAEKNRVEAEKTANEIGIVWEQLQNEVDKTIIAKKLADFQTSFGNQAGQILNSILGLRK